MKPWIGESFPRYPCNFFLQCSRYGLSSLRLGNWELLKLMTYQRCSPHFANSLEKFTLYWAQRWSLCMYYYSVHAARRTSATVALHFLQVDQPVLWSPLISPNILCSSSWPWASWPPGILSFQFQSGSLQETEGHISWDFKNNVVKGQFTEMWAGWREPRRMLRHLGATTKGKPLPPLGLKGQGSKPQPTESWSYGRGAAW